MEKKGFWNFFGLTSRKNLLELEKQIQTLDENSKQRQIELMNYMKSQNTILNDNLLRIDAEIKDLNKRIYKLEQVQAMYMQEIKDLSEEMKNDLIKNDMDIEVRNEKRMRVIANRIKEYDGVLTKSDLGLRKILEEYMDVLYSIVYRIDNMDPIVNMEKMESLLKMLVVNDMMDEIDKIHNK